MCRFINWFHEIVDAESTKNNCSSAVNICKEYNVDCLNIYQTFNAYNKDKWQKYISSLENPEDYMQNVDIYVNVKLRGLD